MVKIRPDPLSNFRIPDKCKHCGFYYNFMCQAEQCVQGGRMDKESIKDWTSAMLYAKIIELEYEYEQLQAEYNQKRSEIVHDYNLVQTMISNRNVMEDINKNA